MVSNGLIELDDDDWYAESFTRYNELVMLEMEWTVRRLRVIDQTTVTILAEKKENTRHFLVQYSLPSKIIRADQVVKKGDLTIVSALSLVDESLINIECVPNENTTIASLKGQNGLQIFCQDLDDSGQFKRSPHRAEVPLLEPEFCFVDAQLFLATKQTSDPCYLVNRTTNAVETVNIPEWSDSSLLPESPLVPEALSRNSIAVCRQLDGRTICYDIRSNKSTHDISAKEKQNSAWTFTSSYGGNQNSSSELICFKSSDGTYQLYDLRASKGPVVESHLPERSRPDLIVKFSPDSRSISTTTSDGLVHIYRIGESNFRQVFSHEGHLRMENCSRETGITDHSWYDPSCVISSADNGSLNIWQFNES